MINLDLIINEMEHAKDLEKVELEIDDLLELDTEVLESIIPDLSDEVIEILEKYQEAGLIPEVKLANKTSSAKKKQSMATYKKNKAKILVNRKKLRKNGKGKVKKEKKERMEKIGKTLTGRRRVKYHTKN